MNLSDAAACWQVAKCQPACGLQDSTSFSLGMISHQATAVSLCSRSSQDMESWQPYVEEHNRALFSAALMGPTWSGWLHESSQGLLSGSSVWHIWRSSLQRK